MDSKEQLLEDGGNPAWIFTFADLMTLLLVFFVLLFSLSKVESDQFESAVRSLNEALKGAEGANSVVDFQHTAPVVADDIEIDSQEKLAAKNIAETESRKPNENVAENQDVSLDAELQKLADDLNNQLQVSSLSEGVEVGSPKDGKIAIQVNGDLLFPPGSAEFNVEMMTTLDQVVLMLKKNPKYKIQIHGHTDNVPIATTRFPSNWELSAIRATNILRYMSRGGIDISRLSATGYGESLPIAPNSTVEGRAQNRRLEFVLEREK